jgi:hypothetical protein
MRFLLSHTVTAATVRNSLDRNLIHTIVLQVAHVQYVKALCYTIFSYGIHLIEQIPVSQWHATTDRQDFRFS